MELNSIIKDKFSRLLFSADFNISDDTKNRVIYKSSSVTIKFIYNPFSYDCNFFIGLNNETVEYESFIVENYLKIIREPIFGLKEQNEKIELWAKKTLSYFEMYKDTLVKGDKRFYTGLNNYYIKTTEEYNKKFNP